MFPPCADGEAEDSYGLDLEMLYLCSFPMDELS